MASDILVKVGADISDFSRKMTESNKALSEFTRVNEETFGAFKKTGAMVTGVGAALAGGLGFAVKTAANFESSMSKVAAVSGATGDDFDALSDKAREMGAATSFSASDAADGLQYMALAGWDTQQMLEGIEPILHLAEAGALDLGLASDLVTDSMAALGLEVHDLDGYLDKVAQTSRKSNTDIDTLMEAMVIAGGTFSRFNVPLEEANAFLGVLANRGTKGSEAGTALNAIMDRLTSGTGEAAKGLEELGVSAFDSEGNFKGMEAVMREINDALSGLTDEEKAYYQSMIAGLNHGKSFEKMLQGLGDEYDDLKGSIADSNGALQDMRDVMKDNLEGALENLSSAFEEIMITLGDALVPAVKLVADWLQKLADWFNGLSKNTKSTIAIIGALAAVFALVAGPVLLLIGFIPQIIAGFTAVMTVVKSLGVVFTLLTSPIALIGIAVAALAILIYKYWDEIKEFTIAAWNAISDFFSDLWASIKDGVVSAWQAIADFFAELWQSMKDGGINVWNKFKNGLAEIWDGIKTSITAKLTEIKDAIISAWNNAKSNTMAVFNAIKDFISTAWSKIKSTIANLLVNIVSTVKRKFTEAVNAVRDKMRDIKDRIKNGWNSAVKFLKGINLRSIGRDIIQGLINGIKSKIAAVGNAVKSVTSQITGKIKSILKISSPSRLLDQYGRWTGEGLVGGIKRTIGAVSRVSDALADAAVPEISGISLAYSTPSGMESTLARAVSGTVDVRSNEHMIANAIHALEHRLANLEIVMDERVVGAIVEPHISGIQDRKGFRKRATRGGV